MRALLIIIVFLLSCLPEMCHSVGAPTFNRLTGLIDIPTAHVIPDGTMGLGFHGASPNKEGEGFRWDGNIWFGIGERVEFGITSLDRGVRGNIKFLLLKEEEGNPGIAIGIENIGGRRPNLYGEEYGGEENSVYAVLSKSFGKMRGHVGFGTGRFVGYGPISKYLHGLFFGVEREFLSKSSQSLKGIVEFSDGRDTNLGLRYKAHEGLSLDLALNEIENILDTHEDLFPAYSFGVTWIIPLKEKGIRSIKEEAHLPITERARIVEEKVVKEGVITHPPDRYLTSRNLILRIMGVKEREGYLVVDLLIENISEEPIYTNPNYFALVNDEGERFYYSSKTFLEMDSFLGGRVWPGGKIEGALIFPCQGTPKELIYNDGWKNLLVKDLK